MMAFTGFDDAPCSNQTCVVEPIWVVGNDPIWATHNIRNYVRKFQCINNLRYIYF